MASSAGSTILVGGSSDTNLRFSMVKKRAQPPPKLGESEIETDNVETDYEVNEYFETSENEEDTMIQRSDLCHSPRPSTSQVETGTSGTVLGLDAA